MPDIKIIKLKIRRGTDVQRKSVVLEQGELGYTIDYKRVFVGDGSTLGGNAIGSKAHQPTEANLSTITSAVNGDIVLRGSLLYQLTGSSNTAASDWVYIGTQADNSTINFNGSKLAIKDNGITGNKFNTAAAYLSGGILVHPTLGLSANVDNSTITVTATGKLSVNQIDQRHVAASTFSQGIQSDADGKYELAVDPDQFRFNSNILVLSGIPSYTLSSIAGTGLEVVSNKLSTKIKGISDSNFQLNGGNQTLELKPILQSSGTAKFSNIVYNTFGQITGATPTIVLGVSSGVTAAYNGHIDQTIFTNQTLVTTVSTNPSGSTVTGILTSAGFILIDTQMGKLALPVFKHNYNI